MSVVILGFDIREAMSIAMSRRDKDRGKHVVLVSMTGHTPWQRIQGLRVQEYEASPRASEHRSWPRTHEVLEHSQHMIGATPQ